MFLSGNQLALGRLVRLKDELHGFRYDIEYNYHEYSDEKVYITLGFNIGVATKYFYINNKNAYTNNLAFANVFANVDRTVTSISIGADKNTWTTKLMALFHIIFADSLDEKVFEDAHKLSLTRFEKAYKQGEFRAVYKAYEYADTNKGYKLHTLIEDIQNISFSDFLAARNNLVIPSNMCVYVNGCIGSVSDEERETINDWIVKNKVTAAMGGRIVDQRLKEDAHLLELSRQNVNMDILSLGFEENVSELDKMIYMVIEADKISGEGKTLHVDRFDSSIIVTTSEVLKLQNYLKRPATQQQFDMTREGLLGKYNQWLEGNPIRFNMMAVELKLNGTNIVDYIGTIANLTYQNYEEIAKKIRPIVSEAQIVMRRG